MSVHFARRGGIECVRAARAIQMRSKGRQRDARHVNVTRIDVQCQRAICAVTQFRAPLSVTDPVLTHHDLLGFIIRARVRVRQGAGQIGVDLDEARDAEAEPVERRCIDMHEQVIARCAETPLNDRVIARHRQVHVTGQQAHTDQLHQAVTGHGQAGIHRILQRKTRLDRQLRCETAVGVQRTGDPHIARIGRRT